MSDNIFKGSDGSVLLYSHEPYSGRLIVVGGDLLSGDILVTGLSYNDVNSQLSYKTADGITHTIYLGIEQKFDKSNVSQTTGDSTDKVMSQKAATDNFAHLVDGKVPASQLPSYVDDVVEYDSKNNFPEPGETGKIYVDTSTNLTYRWSGSTYIQVGGGDLALENGTGTGSLVQKRLKSDGVTWTTAKAYQGAGAAFGGGTQAGRTEEQFYNYFWDNTTNTPLHGGQGKNSDGEVLDNRGLTYSKSYSYGVAEGETTKALGRGSHSEGSGTEATGEYSHAEGYHSYSTGDTSHSEGWNTKANGRASHSEGEESRAEAVGSHAEGYNSKALASYSHAEGVETESQGTAAHSEGQNTKAIGNNSHAEGDTTIANGESSHAEGRQTASNGLYSHAEGYKSKVQTTAYTPPTGSGGSGSGITEGEGEDDPTTHIGQGAHAEGILTISAGYATHAEGARTAASGMYSHAEGYGTYADGICHAEGYRTTAKGGYAHSEGYNTVASHAYSHTEGFHTRSSREAQHVGGKYNADNINALHIVGNGNSENDRKNAFEVLENGTIRIPNFDSNGNRIGMATLKVVNGVLTVIV